MKLLSIGIFQPTGAPRHLATMNQEDSQKAKKFFYEIVKQNFLGLTYQVHESIHYYSLRNDTFIYLFATAEKISTDNAMMLFRDFQTIMQTQQYHLFEERLRQKTGTELPQSVNESVDNVETWQMKVDSLLDGHEAIENLVAKTEKCHIETQAFHSLGRFKPVKKETSNPTPQAPRHFLKNLFMNCCLFSCCAGTVENERESLPLVDIRNQAAHK